MPGGMGKSQDQSHPPEPGQCLPPGLKNQLDGRLQQPGRAGADDLAKGGTIHIAVHRGWPEKLRVIENVEALHPELQRLGLGQGNRFHQRHVVVVEPRSIKETASGVSRCTQGLQTEERSVEIRLSIAWIGIQIERSGCELRLVYAIVVDAVRLRAQQGIVAVVEQGDRKTAAEMSDAGNGPTLRPTVGNGKQAIERELPGITHHKVVRDVESRQSPAERGIDGIHFLADAGRLIDRFAECITSKYLQSFAGMAKAEFEG